MREVVYTFPIPTKDNYHRLTIMAFYISLGIFLFAPTRWIYYYFPIQLFISIGGLCIATKQWKQFDVISKPSILFRYVLPFILIFSRAYPFIVHYGWSIFIWTLLAMMVYSTILFLCKKKTVIAEYGAANVRMITASVSIVFLAMIIGGKYVRSTPFV